MKITSTKKLFVSCLFVVLFIGNTSSASTGRVIKLKANKAPVYLNNRTIGYVYHDADLFILDENEDYYRIRVWGGKSEFYGWVKKEDIENPKIIPDIVVGNNPQIRLSSSETQKRVYELLKVPYYSRYSGTKTINRNTKGSGSRAVKETRRVYVKLPVAGRKKSDGYASLAIFSEWMDVDGFDFMIDEKISEFEKLSKKAHSKFFWIIRDYISALKELKEGKKGNFDNIFDRAEKRRNNLGKL